jgi:hypothetical protein
MDELFNNHDGACYAPKGPKVSVCAFQSSLAKYRNSRKSVILLLLLLKKDIFALNTPKGSTSQWDYGAILQDHHCIATSVHIQMCIRWGAEFLPHIPPFSMYKQSSLQGAGALT